MSDTLNLSANDNCMLTVHGYLLGVMSMREALSLGDGASAWAPRFGAIGEPIGKQSEAHRPGSDVIAEVCEMLSGERYRFHATIEGIDVGDPLSTARFTAIRDVTGLDAFVAAATPVAA